MADTAHVSIDFVIVSAVLLLDSACERIFELLTFCSLFSSYVMRRRRLQYLRDTAIRRRQYLRRRRSFISASVTTILNLNLTTQRKLWSRERQHGQVFMQSVLNFQDVQWKCHFRMSRHTFHYLLDLMSPALSRQTTNFRSPIEPSRRLAIALWWYATPGEYRTIACLFGVGLSTVCTIVHEVTRALVDNLYHRFISLPHGQRLDKTILGFVESGYPQCAGAIDGTHIPIIAPHDNPADYYNRKGWHSIVLQAVVDHKYCFTDVFIGWPGRSHDARVLANSDLYRVAEDKQGGYLFPREKSKFVDGVEIPVHIIGDAAYPLRRWLMKGFTQHVQLSSNQITYTHTLSSARMVVENAFGRLKGRWRCLMKRNDVDINIMPNIVAACCILHNLCEFQREEFLPEWTKQASAAYPALDCEAYLGDHSGSAEQMRSAIMANLPSLLR
ncbi:uncharacterized protein LOC135056457 [Pseudophryne corroboree]|uniref:uncharacterized protein LOC135056457 n=1 Tax=Pseudophryne corroboree TaxID=495146 RepID=UPI003081F8D0